MNAEVFLDTNILLYALDETPSEQQKSHVARRILQSENWGWSIQVAQEFYVNAINPKKGTGLSHTEAEVFIKTWMSFPLAINNAACLLDALEISHRFQISLCDANIIAAARQLNCKRLMSEDLNAGQNYDGVVVENPFAL